MPRKRQQQPDANAAKYFVPPVRRRPKGEPVSQGTKYFERTYPLPDELPRLWDGTGPELPEGYEGAEACPDCSVFRFAEHERLCIRNPNQNTFNMATAWDALRTKEQIFFGAGHPILRDVDDYMTVAKQERLTKLAVVVLYDYPVTYGESSPFKTPNEPDIERRSVIVSWRRRNTNRKV